MPRYHFHVRRGQMTFLDNEGIELPDVDQAALEAARRARQIARREALVNGMRIEAGSVVVDDESHTLLELPLEE